MRAMVLVQRSQHWRALVRVKRTMHLVEGCIDDMLDGLVEQERKRRDESETWLRVQTIRELACSSRETSRESGDRER